MNKLFSEIFGISKKTSRTWLILLKIMIPISIFIKILSELGFIDIISDFLSPMMGIIGLPGEFGIVWATALTTNIYGSLLVFFSLSVENIYSVSQVTILSSIILIAHNFPIEIRIAHKAGIKIWFMFFFRFFCALIKQCKTTDFRAAFCRRLQNLPDNDR